MIRFTDRMAAMRWLPGDGPGEASAQLGPRCRGGALVDAGQPADRPILNGQSVHEPLSEPVHEPLHAPSQPTTPEQRRALYFFAAQQANGGIGSGRLSGARPVADGRGAGAAGAEAPRSLGRRSTTTAGAGGASRYFSRVVPEPARSTAATTTARAPISRKMGVDGGVRSFDSRSALILPI